MADEQVSIGLNTAGYEGPLKSLTTAMNTFNTASVVATAQQKQMAKVMTDLGSIYANYAKILVQTAKATAIAVEGPSEALNKRFQNAQRVLANMDRELQKLQATGEKISNIALVPKDLSRTGKAFGDAFERVFKGIEQRATGMREKVVAEVTKASGTTGTIGGTAVVGKTDIHAQALIDNKMYDQRVKQWEAAAQRAKEIEQEIADDKYTKLRNEANFENNMYDQRVKQWETAAQRAKEIEQEIADDKYTKLRNEANFENNMYDQRVKQWETAAHRSKELEEDKVNAVQTAIHAEALSENRLYDQRVKQWNAAAKLTKELEEDKVNAVQTAIHAEALLENRLYDQRVKQWNAAAKLTKDLEIGPNVQKLTGAFKEISGVDVLRMNARQQAIMHETFTATAKAAQKENIEIVDLIASWKRYKEGTLVVNQDTNTTVQLLNNLTAAHDRASMAVDKHTRQWQRFSQLIMARALTAAFYNLTNALRAGVTAALDVSIAIGEIQTVSHDLPLSYERWSQAILDISNKYNALQKDVAEGFYQTISNQVAQGQQAVDFMETSAAFAKATVSTMEDSVNLLSAALNAFQIPVEQTIIVAAELFKTIELGRIRASDMADTLGRSAIMAHQAGISFEEYLAMIEQFTISGVRFSQTSTFIINVINKLMKPSAEMKKLFQEWGVSSGQAAIQIYGLSGVLQKLLQETSGDLGELSDIIKDIRGITGVAGLITNLDQVQANIRETAQGVRDYFQAVKEVTTTTGYVITAEANKVKNIFISQAATALNVLAIIDRAAGKLGMSLSGTATAITPAVEALTVLGTFTIGRTLLDYDVETTKLISRWGRKLALLVLFEEIIRNTVKMMRSYEGVTNRATLALESSTVDLLTVAKQYEKDIQTLNQKHIQELIKNQEKEKLLLQLQVDTAKENQKELLQIAQQTREQQRDELKKRIADLEQANKNAEKYIDDTRRKFQEQLIEEQKSNPMTSPFEVFDITIQGARNLYGQAMQTLMGASSNEDLKQAQGYFDSFMTQLADARKMQVGMGNLNPVGFDQQRMADFNRFMDAYKQRQQEIETQIIPALRDQLKEVNIEVKTFADGNNLINTALEKQIDSEKELVALLQKKVGLKATEVLMSGESGDKIRATLDIQKQLNDMDRESAKSRQEAGENQLAAQGSLFQSFASMYQDIFAQMITLANMTEGKSGPLQDQITGLQKTIDSFVQVSLNPPQPDPELLKKAQDKTITAAEQEALTQQWNVIRDDRIKMFQEQFPALLAQTFSLERTLEQQAIVSGGVNTKGGTETLRIITDKINQLQETQGYINIGNYSGALATASTRAAQAGNVGEGNMFTKALDDLANSNKALPVRLVGSTAPLPMSLSPTTMSELEQTGYPGFPAPGGGAKGGVVRSYHKGGWVPYMRNGGDVPAYLQAGEFVVDRESAAGWNEWQQWLQTFGSDPVTAYNNLQRQYATVLGKEQALNARWRDTQVVSKTSDISYSDIKAKRNQINLMRAHNVVQGPNGPLDSNQLTAAINALNNVPEMQQVWMESRVQQLQTIYGTKVEDINAQIAQYQQGNQSAMDSYHRKQRWYNEQIKAGTRSASPSNFREYVGDPQSEIAANEAKIAELNWYLTRIPTVQQPNDLLTRVGKSALSAEADHFQRPGETHDQWVARRGGLGVARARTRGDMLEYIDDKTGEKRMMRVADADALVKKNIREGEIAQHQGWAGLLDTMRPILGDWAPLLVDKAMGKYGSGYAQMTKRDREHFSLLNTVGAASMAATGLYGLGMIPGAASLFPEALGREALIGMTGLRRLLYFTPEKIARLMLRPSLGKEVVALSRKDAFELIVPLLKGGPKSATGFVGKGAKWVLKESMGGAGMFGILELLRWLFGDTVEHKAMGGFPGAPRGTDTVPAWLTPGEFVVNANASARYRGLLEQLNSFGGTTRPNFISPQYKQGGGSIGETKIYYNNNVTINHPTGNPALDATRIVQEINRQQSRGTARVRTQ